MIDSVAQQNLERLIGFILRDAGQGRPSENHLSALVSGPSEELCGNHGKLSVEGSGKNAKLSSEFEIFSSIGRLSVGEKRSIRKTRTRGRALACCSPIVFVVLVLELVRVGQRSGWTDLVHLRPSNRMVHACME